MFEKSQYFYISYNSRFARKTNSQDCRDIFVLFVKFVFKIMNY